VRLWLRWIWTGERKILRRVHGPGVQQGMWRITGQELRELYTELDIVIDVKRRDGNGLDM
jgi:hypothetical protein